MPPVVIRTPNRVAQDLVGVHDVLQGLVVPGSGRAQVGVVSTHECTVGLAQLRRRCSGRHSQDGIRVVRCWSHGRDRFVVGSQGSRLPGSRDRTSR